MANAPKKYGIVLYPGFQLIDVCGPVDVLNVLSTHAEGISLSIIADTLEPTSTFPRAWPDKMGMPPFTTSEILTPTHTFQTAPQLDVLIIPGGMGCFDPDPANAGKPNSAILDPIGQFILKQYPSLRYLLTVCTGAGIASLTGLLDGKKATTFKGAWKVIPAWRPQVNWVPQARWVVDGNIWTSSGVCSGIDLMFGFVKAIHGEDIAKDIAVWMEYQRHEDPAIDPFGIEE
ncbi:class I glutamine amidotransferase-like protein [Mariannaea sp. PMI_226]|nr:class I glutamine amidotransferase-like protein [Mariannaea sp. PMI_226]